jgi:hypothetical protein
MHAQRASITGKTNQLSFDAARDRAENGSIQQLIYSMLARSQNNVVTMPPGIAERILEQTNFHGQRKLKPARVMERLIWIQSGMWESGFAISFIELPDGTFWLVDGQHRLHAIMEHETSVKLRINIMRAEDEDHARRIYAGFDKSDASRTDIEILDAVQASDEHKLKRATTRALFRSLAILRNNMEPTKSNNADSFEARSTELRLIDMAEWAEEARLYEDCVEHASTWLKVKLLGAGCCAVGLYTIRHQRAKACEFWKGVAQDDGLPKGDPRKALIDDFKNRNIKGGHRPSIQQACIAWNAYFSGRKISYVRATEKAPIAIAGTPMAKGNQ